MCTSFDICITDCFLYQQAGRTWQMLIFGSIWRIRHRDSNASVSHLVFLDPKHFLSARRDIKARMFIAFYWKITSSVCTECHESVRRKNVWLWHSVHVDKVSGLHGLETKRSPHFRSLFRKRQVIRYPFVSVRLTWDPPAISRLRRRPSE